MNRLMKKSLAILMSFTMLLATVAVNGTAAYAVAFTSVVISQAELSSEGGNVTVTVNAWEFSQEGDTIYYEVSSKPADDITAPSEQVVSRTPFSISQDNNTFDLTLPANNTSSDIVYSVKIYSSQDAANAEKTAKCTVKSAGSAEKPSDEGVYSDAGVFRAKVIDAEGNPVQGVTFKAVSNNYPDFDYDAPTGTTNAEGILEIKLGTYMSDGRYNVSMVANDTYTYDGDSHYFTMDANGLNIVDVDGGSLSSTSVTYTLTGGTEPEDTSYTAADFDYGNQDFTLKGRTGGSVTLSIHCVKGLNESGLAKLETNKDLVIPSEDAAGVPVYGIADNAFNKSESLGIESVTIPETEKVSADDFTIGIKSEGLSKRGNFFIGASAFLKNKLSKLELPEGVIYVGSNAFKTNALTEVKLPSTLYQVGSASFAGSNTATVGNLITNLEFPESTDFGLEIDGTAFACNQIEEATLPSNIDTLCCTAFMNNFYDLSDKSFKVVKLYKRGAIDGEGCERLGYIGHDSAADTAANSSKNNKYQTLEAIQKTPEELKEEIEQLNAQIEELKAQIEKLESDGSDNAETIADLEAQIEELNGQIEQLKSEGADKIEALNREILKLKLDGVYLMPVAKAVKYNKVELTWNANANADHYVVYVQEGSGEWTKEDNELEADATSMVFERLKTGIKYSYKVVAVKGDIEGSDSVVTSATPKLAKAAAPKVTGATKSVKASWKSVSGASGYQLSVSTSKKGTKVVKTANVRKYTKKSLKSKKTYYVKVRAYRTVDGAKKYGSWSTVKSVKTK